MCLVKSVISVYNGTDATKEIKTTYVSVWHCGIAALRLHTSHPQLTGRKRSENLNGAAPLVDITYGQTIHLRHR